MNHLLVILNISSNEIWKTFIDDNFTPLCWGVIGLIWGVIGLIAFVFLLKYLLPLFELLIKNKHEIKVKDETFIKEKYWCAQKNLNQDIKKELEKMIKEKEKEIGDLAKEENKKEISDETLKLELKWYKKMLEEISGLECNINEIITKKKTENNIISV
ncbi:MAG: hypothetical protein GX372_06720 [Ignavibacteria bacterium]|jgi:hypothetical protein|nr:hypothetical protein [Ignavibacteria bacterium]